MIHEIVMWPPIIASLNTVAAVCIVVYFGIKIKRTVEWRHIQYQSLEKGAMDRLIEYIDNAMLEYKRELGKNCYTHNQLVIAEAKIKNLRYELKICNEELGALTVLLKKEKK